MEVGWIAVVLLVVNSVQGRLLSVDLHGQHYSMTYEQAAKRCADLGGSLALPIDLYQAKNNGYNQCACGWLADKSARFPSTLSITGCGGKPGVHRCGWRSKWNAFCYLGGPVQNCSRPLGMESGVIRNVHLTSSTTNHAIWGERWGADRARLNQHGVVNAWMPHHDGRNQYVEVDLGRAHAVTGIITQGVRRYLKNQYVTRYRIAYSKDGQLWINYTEGGRTTRIFEGNKDNNGLKRNMFGEAILAQHIRIYPYTWVRHISLRFELLGCRLETYDRIVEELREQTVEVLEY